MADDRTTIIINEIKYWKQHKLLPETYCDYLLALYTKGDYAEEEILDQSKSKILFSIQVFLLMLMVPFSLLVIYFTQFDTILQLGILSLFIVYTLWVYIYQRRTKSLFVHLTLIIFLLLILIFSLFISTLLQVNDWMNLVVLLVNFSVWFLIGLKIKVKYITILGIIGIIITLFYNFSHLFPLN